MIGSLCAMIDVTEFDISVKPNNLSTERYGGVNVENKQTILLE